MRFIGTRYQRISKAGSFARLQMRFTRSQACCCSRWRLKLTRKRDRVASNAKEISFSTLAITDSQSQGMPATSTSTTDTLWPKMKNRLLLCLANRISSQESNLRTIIGKWSMRLETGLQSVSSLKIGRVTISNLTVLKEIGRPCAKYLHNQLLKTTSSLKPCKTQN